MVVNLLYSVASSIISRSDATRGNVAEKKINLVVNTKRLEVQRIFSILTRRMFFSLFSSFSLSLSLSLFLSDRPGVPCSIKSSFTNDEPARSSTEDGNFLALFEL